MSKKEEEATILIYTPPFPRLEYKDLEDIVLTERLNYFNLCKRISKYTAGLMIAASLFYLLFSTYSLMNQIEFTFSKPLLIFTLAFLGLINLLNGLILLVVE